MGIRCDWPDPAWSHLGPLVDAPVRSAVSLKLSLLFIGKKASGGGGPRAAQHVPTSLIENTPSSLRTLLASILPHRGRKAFDVAQAAFRFR